MPGKAKHVSWSSEDSTKSPSAKKQGKKIRRETSEERRQGEELVQGLVALRVNDEPEVWWQWNGENYDYYEKWYGWWYKATWQCHWVRTEW